MQRLIKNLSISIIVMATYQIFAFSANANYCVMDFEQADIGDVSDGGDGLFDADNWGKCLKKEIIGDETNKLFYFEKDSAERGQGLFSKTFDDEFMSDEGYSVEFRLKSDFQKDKVLKLINSNGAEFLNFKFGTGSNVKINERDCVMENSDDGELHSYKFIVNSNSDISFIFDGSTILDDLPSETNCNLSKIQLAVQGNRSENNIYIDDIVVSSLSAPVPDKVSVIYKDNQIFMSAQSDCDIYYTTDLSYPGETADLYTGAINVEQLMYVKAVAVNKDGVRSVCAFAGPYEYIEPPNPFDSEITPQLSDKMYIVDFEDKQEGTISPKVVFDGDYGLCLERLFVKDNNNMCAKVSKRLTSAATDAWLQYTFPDDETYSGNYVMEFSAKQTVARSKALKLSSSAGDDYYFNFVFGDKDKASVNGASVSIPNNLDGSFHHYKFVITENGKVEFYYDGSKAEGEFACPMEKSLKKYRFAVGGTETEGEPNALWIDNIMIYEAADPVPAMPVLSQKADEVEYGTEITLSADDDCAVYYTLDGTIPQFKPEFLYKEPIKITSEGIGIKAVAVRANGNYSACTVSGSYLLINRNKLIALTENPFFVDDPAKVEAAEISLFSLEENKKITVVLALYEDTKLLYDGIRFRQVTLNSGLNENISIDIEKNECANRAVVYIWEEKDDQFYPIMGTWELKFKQ